MNVKVIVKGKVKVKFKVKVRVREGQSNQSGNVRFLYPYHYLQSLHPHQVLIFQGQLIGNHRILDTTPTNRTIWSLSQSETVIHVTLTLRMTPRMGLPTYTVILHNVPHPILLIECLKKYFINFD